MERCPQFTKPDCKYRLCAIRWFRSQNHWLAPLDGHSHLLPKHCCSELGNFLNNNFVKLLSLVHWILGWFVLMGFSLNLMPLALFSFKRPFSILLAINALFLALLNISLLFSYFPSYSSGIWKEKLGNHMDASHHFLCLKMLIYVYSSSFYPCPLCLFHYSHSGLFTVSWMYLRSFVLAGIFFPHVSSWFTSYITLHKWIKVNI